MSPLVSRLILMDAPRALYGPGVSGNYASAPDSVALSITGDIDLRWFGTLDDWTPAADALLMGKWLSSGNQKSYYLKIGATDGKPNLIVSADGTAAITFAASAAPAVTDFSRLGIRVTLDVDNGSAGKTATFYTSPDFVTWTQLGTAVTIASTMTIFDGTASVNVNTIENGGFGTVFGRCYRAQILNGIAGTLAFDANFATQSVGTLSFRESSDNKAVVTVNQSGNVPARIAV